MSIIYDDRFDAVAVEPLEGFRKERLIDVLQAGLDRSTYVTMEDIENEFSVSNYHVRTYLKKLGVSPIGELKNVGAGGVRKRGIGKLVYRASVISEIQELLGANIDISKYQEEARKILEE